MVLLQENLTKYTDTDKIPQCRIPDAWFLAANLLGSLTGNPAGFPPRCEMGQKTPPPALSPLSDKGSTFQVTQAPLSAHAAGRAVPGSAVGPGTARSPARPGPASPHLRRASAAPGAAGRQEGSAAGDLAGC